MNPPACVLGDFPSRSSRRALSRVSFSGMFRALQSSHHPFDDVPHSQSKPGVALVRWTNSCKGGNKTPYALLSEGGFCADLLSRKQLHGNQPSMIALASSRIPELGVWLWKGSRLIHSNNPTQNMFRPSHIPRTSRVGLTDLRNLPSLHANCLRSHPNRFGFRHREDRVYEVRRGCEISIGIELRFPCLLQYEPLQKCQQHA